MDKHIYTRSPKGKHNQIPPPPLGSSLPYSPMRNAKAHHFRRGTIFERYTNFNEVQ